ncbi:hypothetical protein O988_02439 [Pseudogymnoascus sp. VKM F-3808]|nr:hypothetical protein O988_02439 [Pseudogymnoascus sp. VKM F-3808]
MPKCSAAFPRILLRKLACLMSSYQNHINTSEIAPVFELLRQWQAHSKIKMILYIYRLPLPIKSMLGWQH